MPAHRHSEIIGKKRIELCPEDFALGHQGAVLFSERKEMRYRSRFREYNSLAEKKSALCAAYVKRITKMRNIGKRHIVVFCSESVKKGAHRPNKERRRADDNIRKSL